MTDNEIIKALEFCATLDSGNCKKCPCREICNKNDGTLTKSTLNLIHRQKEEIERLEDEIDKQYEQAKADILANIPDGGTSCHWCIDNIKSESVREFAKELKNCFAISGDYLDIINIIDNLVKEMTEVEE